MPIAEWECRQLAECRAAMPIIQGALGRHVAQSPHTVNTVVSYLSQVSDHENVIKTRIDVRSIRAYCFRASREWSRRKHMESKMEILIKKAGRKINVDESRFPSHVRDHLFEYGVRQKLNDAISGYSRDGSASTQMATPDEMAGVVETVLDRLYAGDIRAARAVDTVGRIASQLAMRKVCNVWLAKNKGRELKAYTARAADAAKYLADNRDALMAAAESIAALTSGEDVAE